MQNYDKQYPAMNVGAQRRPASTFGAPAAIWHRAFWRPPHDADGSNATDGTEPASAWELQVDRFLYGLFFELKTRDADAYCPTYSPDSDTLYLFRHKFSKVIEQPLGAGFEDRIELEPDERMARHDVFAMNGKLGEVAFSVRSELHTEYATLTLALDLSAPPAAPEAENLSQLLMQSYLRRIAEFIEQRFSTGPVDTNPKEKYFFSGDKDYTPRKALFERAAEIWTEILECSSERFLTSTASLGGVFAEFYGLALRAYDVQEDSDGPAQFRVNASPKVRPHTPRDRAPLSEARAARLLDAVWPVARGMARTVTSTKEDAQGSSPDGTPERRFVPSNSEYIATCFQDRNSLYVSSLGELHIDHGRSTAEPVTYLIVASYRSRWQLGRIVDRINTLGTLRLAAVRDLSELTEASRELRILQNEIAQHSPAALSAAGIEAYAARHALISGRFEGGLQYRISRSAYYVKLYKEYLSQLREKRIEGYQSYVDFVKRRLFDTFDFIEIVGDRFRQIRNQLQLSADIERTSDMKRLNENLVKQQRRTVGFLAAAEVMIAAPITYYSSETYYKLYVTIFAKGAKQSYGPEYIICLLLGVISAIYILVVAKRRGEKAEISEAENVEKKVNVAT